MSFKLNPSGPAALLFIEYIAVTISSSLISVNENVEPVMLRFSGFDFGPSSLLRKKNLFNEPAEMLFVLIFGLRLDLLVIPRA